MQKFELDGRLDIPLSERVYLTLKKAILRGDLHPGYRLIILDIADAFGVSQAPVREAIERLKHEGLLTAEPNRGSMVSHLTVDEMREVYELRVLIEGYVLEKLLPLSESDIAHLMDILKRMYEAAEGDDLFQFIERDMEFHGWFYERYGNQQIITVWNTIKEKTARFTSITNQLYFADLKAVAEGHVELIRVVQLPDVKSAIALYIKHIQGVWGRMTL